MRSNKGFTLVELLIVVALIIIVVGVTGDIVVSLVRSYSKTQITNEIEQNTNFAMIKLEKELRNASSVENLSSYTLEFTRMLPSGSPENIIYSMNTSNGDFTREIEGDGNGALPLMNNDITSGVYLVPFVSEFTDVSVVGGPTVVHVKLSVTQQGNPAIQFKQSIVLESTIVVRGTY